MQIDRSFQSLFTSTFCLVHTHQAQTDLSSLSHTSYIMVTRTPPDTPGSEEPNSLEESGYDVLSDVVTLTSEEDENDGTTVSLPSYDGDTPDDLSSDVGSDESQNSNRQDNALQFGSTISGTASGLTVTGRLDDHICDTPTSTSVYGSNNRLSWWQSYSTTVIANIPSVYRHIVDDRIRPTVRKLEKPIVYDIIMASIFSTLAILGTISLLMGQSENSWYNGSSQPELMRRNAALDSAVSSMVPKSPISFPKLISSVPHVGRSQRVSNLEEPWIGPNPHPLSPEANESNRFKMQALGCCNIIITSPFQSHRLASYQQINVEIERSGEPISFELSHLVEGVDAVTLDAEEAHGELEVRVWTVSRPYVNQTISINMGSPLYKIASWKSFFSENSRKAKTTLTAAADMTLQNINALAHDGRIIRAKLKESFDENVPFIVKKVQRYTENGVSLAEKGFLSSASRFRDFKYAILSASKQGHHKTGELKDQFLNNARVFMLELRDRARLYQRQTKPVNDLLRTGMRSTMVKRASSQAVDLWIRIKNLGGRPISNRIGSGLGKLNVKNLIPWGDYEFSISRGFQCSSGSNKSRSKNGRSRNERRSEWVPTMDWTRKRARSTKSSSRGVLRL